MDSYPWSITIDHHTSRLKFTIYDLFLPSWDSSWMDPASFRHDSGIILAWFWHDFSMIFQWFWWCLRMIPKAFLQILRGCFGPCPESILQSSGQQKSRFPSPTKNPIQTRPSGDDFAGKSRSCHVESHPFKGHHVSPFKAMGLSCPWRGGNCPSRKCERDHHCETWIVLSCGSWTTHYK